MLLARLLVCCYWYSLYDSFNKKIINFDRKWKKIKFIDIVSEPVPELWAVVHSVSLCRWDSIQLAIPVNMGNDKYKFPLILIVGNLQFVNCVSRKEGTINYRETSLECLCRFIQIDELWLITKRNDRLTTNDFENVSTSQEFIQQSNEMRMNRQHYFLMFHII